MQKMVDLLNQSDKICSVVPLVLWLMINLMTNSELSLKEFGASIIFKYNSLLLTKCLEGRVLCLLFTPGAAMFESQFRGSENL